MSKIEITATQPMRINNPVEAAFLALKSHTYLSLFVALASMVTIVVICASYSQIIELFPTGGGGYLVAYHDGTSGR